MARLIGIVLLGLLVACGQPEKKPTTVNASAARERSQEPAPLDNSAGMANLTIVNVTDRQLVLLYASPSGDENWGPDLLEGVVVVPGQDVTFVLPPGWWDVKCVLSDEDVVTFAELELEADDYTLELAPEDDEEGPSEDDEEGR